MMLRSLLALAALGAAIAGCNGGGTTTPDARADIAPASVHEVRPGESIQAAIDAAKPGEVVLIYPGTYKPAAAGEAFLVVRAGKNGLTLRGAGKSPDEVVLDGAKQVLHVIYFDEGIGRETHLENLTVTGGRAYPGASTARTLRPEIELSDDLYYDGGGLMLFRAAPTVSGCRVIGNEAERCGAGISVFAYASSGFPTVGPLIRDSEISGNTLGATDGSGTGGGVDIYNGARAELVNDLLSGNNGWGAVAVLDDTVATIESCTFADNASFPLAGSGLAKITLASSIFARNADEALHVDEQTITYRSCAFFENGPNAWTPPAGQGHVAADPLLVKGPRGSYYLSQRAAGQTTDSPCVDAGDGQAAARGLERRTTRSDGQPDAGALDMGYHYQP